MSKEERPLYGELVIPFNVEEQSEMHSETVSRAEHLRTMIKMAAYFLAEKRGFVSGHELEDWLKAEIEILRNLKLGHGNLHEGNDRQTRSPSQPIASPHWGNEKIRVKKD